ncbi:MAG TPA: hydantoinase B/oxoprolinase family protein, partial [Geminicoccaceae bacterium]|nr:hydantoinase B/oxoprolinase family protein [Geminicoccaceae bacterium]
GAMNVAESALRATVYYAVKTLLDPGLLPNSGMAECIEIRAPEGSIVNPRFPAAVGARSITCNKIARALFGAFAALLPRERTPASSQDIVPCIVFSGERRRLDGNFVYLETMGGGVGARFGGDGMDGVHVHVTNTSNLPVEALENQLAPSSSAPASEVMAPPSKPAITARTATGAKPNSPALHSVGIGGLLCVVRGAKPVAVRRAGSARGPGPAGTGWRPDR